jgi:hypothetical protein
MVGSPPRHLRAQPELEPATVQVNHGTGHILVSRLVLAHRVAMRKTEDLGDGLGVNEVVDVDFLTHARTLHP